MAVSKSISRYGILTVALVAALTVRASAVTAEPAGEPVVGSADLETELAALAAQSGASGDVSMPAVEESAFKGFMASFCMILVSEIGDKTFLIAAIMAMRSSRLLVFTSAFGALFLMTVLSAVIGHALPTLLSPKLTHYLAALFFVIFGIKLFKEGTEMKSDEGVEEELQEVQSEIESKVLNQQNEALETGESDGNLGSGKGESTTWRTSLMNLLSFIFSPEWIQVFVMTFLGEWGDRSQFATIAMAAGSDYWCVTLGGILGHAVCTGIAVLGGQFIATKISMKTVVLGGAVAFIVFAVMYFFEALNYTE